MEVLDAWHAAQLGAADTPAARAATAVRAQNEEVLRCSVGAMSGAGLRNRQIYRVSADCLPIVYRCIHSLKDAASSGECQGALSENRVGTSGRGPPRRLCLIPASSLETTQRCWQTLSCVYVEASGFHPAAVLKIDQLYGPVRRWWRWRRAGNALSAARASYNRRCI
jgi:hypothetical protein